MMGNTEYDLARRSMGAVLKLCEDICTLRNLFIVNRDATDSCASPELIRGSSIAHFSFNWVEVLIAKLFPRIVDIQFFLRIQPISKNTKC